jgi:lysozyme
MFSDRDKLWILFALSGAAAYLWFSASGRQAAAQAGSAIASGVFKVIDLANSTLQLIKRFEGFSSIRYRDARGFSIGYGHFIQPGESFPASFSEPEAYDLLRADTQRFSETIKNAVTVTLTQNQFDALVSLAYNIGATAFRNSTLVRKLNAGDYAGAAEQFAVWRISEGAVNPVLVARRATEREIFLS